LRSARPSVAQSKKQSKQRRSQVSQSEEAARGCLRNERKQRGGRTAVNDLTIVKVRNGADDLVNETRSITLGIRLKLYDLVEELTSLDPGVSAGEWA
jgi:hypothetical protein